jgi:hypothetical protein
MTFRAGQKVLASELNQRAPLFAYLDAFTSVTKTSSTTMSAVTGLSVAVDADAVYLLDGMIGYNTPAAVDLRLALVCPSGSTGHWGAFALASTSTAGIGSMEMIRQTSFGTGTYVVMGGSDTTDQLAAPHAYIDTGSTAGSVEFWFAQNSSSASATTIGSGSWLRLTRVL